MEIRWRTNVPQKIGENMQIACGTIDATASPRYTTGGFDVSEIEHVFKESELWIVSAEPDDTYDYYFLNKNDSAATLTVLAANRSDGTEMSAAATFICDFVAIGRR